MDFLPTFTRVTAWSMHTKFRVQWEHVLSLSKTLLLNTGYWRQTEICWDTLNQPNNQTVLWNFRKDRIFKSLLIRNPLNCSNAKLCGLYLLHRYFKESTDRPLYRVHSYIFSSKYPKINSPCDKVRWQIRKFHYMSSSAIKLDIIFKFFLAPM